MPHQLDKVVLHPRETRFAVFHSIAKEEYGTRVSIFDASSSSPPSVYTLPFQVRNAVYDPSQAGTGFNLVGITHDWRAVLIGDSACRFTDESRLAKGINLDSQPEKRTLFQNIFGASAFVDDFPAYDHSISPSLSQKKSDHSMFDTLAFATPSLDTMFDPLITTLLSTREVRSDEVIHDIASEDDGTMMEDQGGILTSTRRSSRALRPGELETFTKLFRTSCIMQGLDDPILLYVADTVPTGVTTPVAKVNGKVSKSTRTEYNGLRPSTASPAFVPKKVLPLSTEDGDDTSIAFATSAPNPTSNNKKRKKGHS